MVEWWNGGRMVELLNGNRIAEWQNGGMAEWGEWRGGSTLLGKCTRVLGKVDLAHPDQQRTDGLELPEFRAELEQLEEQNK